MHFVLLPGLHGTTALFDPFVAVAPSGSTFTRVVYPPTGPQAYDTLTGFAEAELPTGTDFVIIAESFSGPIGIRLSAKRPAGLQALVLIASFARSPVPAVLAHIPWRVYRLLPMQTRIPRIFLGGYPRGNDFDRALRAALETVTREMFYGRVQAILGVDVTAQLAQVEVPILYLRASRDWVVPARCGRLVKGVAAEASVVEVDGPHLLAQVSAYGVWREVLDFWAGVALIE